MIRKGSFISVTLDPKPQREGKGGFERQRVESPDLETPGPGQIGIGESNTHTHTQSGLELAM